MTKTVIHKFLHVLFLWSIVGSIMVNTGVCFVIHDSTNGIFKYFDLSDEPESEQELSLEKDPQFKADSLLISMIEKDCYVKKNNCLVWGIFSVQTEDIPTPPPEMLFG